MEVELEKKPKVELRSFELDQALKKPKTTVVELRAFERCTCQFDQFSAQWNFIYHRLMIPPPPFFNGRFLGGPSLASLSPLGFLSPLLPELEETMDVFPVTQSTA